VQYRGGSSKLQRQVKGAFDNQNERRPAGVPTFSRLSCHVDKKTAQIS
jgi:hypothetical protein